jgi:hypothetical protein
MKPRNRIDYTTFLSIREASTCLYRGSSLATTFQNAYTYIDNVVVITDLGAHRTGLSRGTLFEARKSKRVDEREASGGFVEAELVLVDGENNLQTSNI